MKLSLFFGLLSTIMQRIVCNSMRNKNGEENDTVNVKKIFKICFSECSKHDGTISLYSC